MRKNKLTFFALFLLSLALIFTACGGGGGGGDSSGTSGGGGTPPSTFSGFDISLSEGTYWEYCWTYEHVTFAQGSSGTTVDAGNFRVTLGKPIVIGGVTAYPVSITGDSLDVDNHDYAPRWKYIAVDNERIRGSVNGTTLEIIFDAKTGKWQGGGFFTTFSPSANIEATNSSINNEFINTPAVRVGWAAGQTQCQTIAGYTVCPNDTAYALTESEYYKGGIGPIGYNFSLDWSSSGGGVYTAFTFKRKIGLVATSLKAVDGFVPKLPPWTKKADWPTPRINHSCAVYNGKIYIFGGSTSNAVDVYNPATNTWTSLSPMPISRSYHTSTEVNGKIYVIGGTSGTTQLARVDIYDPVANTWTSGNAMPQAQIGHRSTAAGGYIWVFLDDSQTVYAYSVAGNNWAYGTSMPNSYYRRSASDISINDKIYVIGGLDTFAQAFKTTCMAFDLSQLYGSSLAWTYKKSMPTGRRSLTSPVVNGKVYAIGGFNYNGYQRVVEVYDPATDIWTAKRSMMTPRESLVSAVVNGKIYVIGGRNDTATTLASVEEYDPANDI